MQLMSVTSCPVTVLLWKESALYSLQPPIRQLGTAMLLLPTPLWDLTYQIQLSQPLILCHVLQDSSLKEETRLGFKRLNSNVINQQVNGVKNLQLWKRNKWILRWKSENCFRERNQTMPKSLQLVKKTGTLLRVLWDCSLFPVKYFTCSLWFKNSMYFQLSSSLVGNNMNLEEFLKHLREAVGCLRMKQWEHAGMKMDNKALHIT